MKKRVIVVLGAGSSLRAGAPSVENLTRAVLAMETPRVRGDVADFYVINGGAIRPALETMGMSPNIPAVRLLGEGLRTIDPDFNYETVLHAIETLEPYVASRTFIPDLVNVRPVITAFTDPAYRYQALFNYVMLWTMRWDIIRCVRDAVIDRTRAPKAEAVNLSTSFISKLRNVFTPEVYNLNYDTLWDDTADWFDGFLPAERFAVFETKKYFDTLEGENPTMNHLHGSVRYGYPERGEIARLDSREIVKYPDVDEAGNSLRRDNIPQPSYTEASIDDAAPLISGGAKTLKFNAIPYSYYHAALQQTYRRSNRLLFIGYGFTDPHINNWAHLVLRHDENAKVAIIDYRPKDGPWKLSETGDFVRLKESAGAAGIDLNGNDVVEIAIAGRMAITGHGYPPRSDLADSILSFLEGD